MWSQSLWNMTKNTPQASFNWHISTSWFPWFFQLSYHRQTTVKWSHKICWSVNWFVNYIQCHVSHYLFLLLLLYLLRLQLCAPAVKCDHRSFVLAQNAASVSLLHLTTKPFKAIQSLDQPTRPTIWDKISWPSTQPQWLQMRCCTLVQPVS